ncbi:hypothetical protein RC74_16020 [Falsihalocynthiibacter arcticus]|uniref:Uncharacterized protein n=1 Tax=Falsihalocynthiibacter arcticus TaxID=1579316 RepID=A0A126V2R5_9RHOB|nr:hypothetical protein RC74_16020 [Falsihalocynthiibacter arcticus]
MCRCDPVRFALWTVILSVLARVPLLTAHIAARLVPYQVGDDSVCGCGQKGDQYLAYNLAYILAYIAQTLNSDIGYKSLILFDKLFLHKR